MDPRKDERRLPVLPWGAGSLWVVALDLLQVPCPKLGSRDKVKGEVPSGHSMSGDSEGGEDDGADRGITAAEASQPCLRAAWQPAQEESGPGSLHPWPPHLKALSSAPSQPFSAARPPTPQLSVSSKKAPRGHPPALAGMPQQHWH